MEGLVGTVGAHGFCGAVAHTSRCGSLVLLGGRFSVVSVFGGTPRVPESHDGRSSDEYFVGVVNDHCCVTRASTNRAVYPVPVFAHPLTDHPGHFFP